MGTSAISLGERGVPVTAIAWHPTTPMLAIGYHDGSVQLCRSEDGDMLPMHQADGDPVAFLAFAAHGRQLGALSTTGKLCRFDLAA